MSIKMKNHLYFLRHGKTIYNEKHLITGQADISILNTEEKMNINLSQPLNNMIILSSPLKRCQETVKSFQQNIDYNLPIKYCDELLERNMGIFEEMERKLASEEYPIYFTDGKFKYYMTPPNGESFYKVCVRAELFIQKTLNELLESHDVLICSHNQIMKIIYFKIMNIPFNDNWYEYSFINNIIYKIF